ncbi:primosomal protein N' [Luteipulveratus mongoliensis]|uniref:Probable replication restart protein PriA n=1 Tax=Luteipulveratus mongoliensis TaxID=571913 RepID=A0A0K1JJH3_9MICO|nr:primosomal protein N' [Luteipulveratus mongoliensis]AKU16728.1 primosome assembly protein PriA [Luteipulveratus mongoliensis]
MTEEGASAAAEQLALLQAVAPASTPRPRTGPALASKDPVAVVHVDTGLPHLDRPFEYSVPATLADDAVPGCRLKVRFAGQDVDAFLLERRAEAEHTGRLTPIRRVVSAEPVLTDDVLQLARGVAAQYAGTLGDVLRLAIPPRHARAEKALAMAPPESAPETAGATRHVAWEPYPAGPALLQRIADGGAPAASWLARPTVGPELDWPSALAELAQTALSAGRGVVLVVPDGRDTERLDEALRDRLGAGQHVRLSADQGPQARYTAWLKLLRGHVRCVVGTRAAAFAPVRDLGLLVCWDDGDDALTEPRAPYAHARDVLAMRAEQQGAALVLGGHTRSVPVQAWLEAGRVRAVEAPRDRSAHPRTVVTGDERDVERSGPAALAHLPSRAWAAAKEALQSGPVLVQVPRRGYLPSLSCQRCRTPARCATCHGPLGLVSPDRPPACRWCGRVEPAFRCPECDDTRLRSSVVGARRTAEELGRAFPGVPLHRSAAGEMLDRVGPDPSLVIATPGAEPVAESGYAATLLLDAWAFLDRPVLEAQAEAVRRWTAAAALTRPSTAGGVVVLCGAPTHTTIPAVEALVRWAPGWFAERELHERAELRLPPSCWVAELTGPRVELSGALTALDLPTDVEVLGPLPVGTRRAGESEDGQRLLLRCEHDQAALVLARLTAMRAARSARKDVAIGVRVDPDPSLL